MNYSIKNKFEEKYQLIWIVMLGFTVLAFILDTPKDILIGMKHILFGRAVLITDYMVIGGVGAALINAVLNTILCVGMLKLTKTEATGATVAGIWMNIGFGLFGKNVVNSIPIFLGIYLYSRFIKQPFSSFMLVTLLSSTLGPIVSEFLFIENVSILVSLPLGMAIGMFLGFVVPPIGKHLMQAHKGFCLYNVGFTGGCLAMLLTFVCKSFGLTFESQLHWYTEDQALLFWFMIGIGIVFIVYGWFTSNKENIFTAFKHLTNEVGILPSDFLVKYGNVSYINMGILCILGTILVYAIGGDFNGPTIGGILTLMAFGCFGKTLKNCIPVLAGALLASALAVQEMTAPSFMLAILFSVGVAPVAGKYGFVWGVVAGVIHVTLATNMSALNSGLNLYNNGFAAGFGCMLLIPFIEIWKKNKS